MGRRFPHLAFATHALSLISFWLTAQSRCRFSGTLGQCLLNACYEDTFPDGLDGKDLPAVGRPGLEPWGGERRWTERSRGALCVVCSVMPGLTWGRGFSIPSSGLQLPQCLSCLLPCHSLALNSAHELSHILVSIYRLILLCTSVVSELS